MVQSIANAEDVPTVRQRIHDQTMFVTGHLFEAVANSAVADVIITTDVIPHVGMSVTAQGNAHLFLFEDPTATTVGSNTLTIGNCDRNSVLATSASASHTPSVTGTGTQIGRSFMGGGIRNSAVGGEATTQLEFILLPNTKYLFRATNKSGGAADISINIAFYEPNA